MTIPVSTKAIAAFLFPFVVAIALWLITGNDTYLVGLLLAALAGGGAAAAPPTGGVTQVEVSQLAKLPKVTRAKAGITGKPR